MSRNAAKYIIETLSEDNQDWFLGLCTGLLLHKATPEFADETAAGLLRLVSAELVAKIEEFAMVLRKGAEAEDDSPVTEADLQVFLEAINDLDLESLGE